MAVGTSVAALSTQYLRYTVAAKMTGTPYNPTADTVQFAFPATGVQPSSWLSGSWETNTGTPGVTPNSYVARVLVGPGTGGVVTFTVGNSYDVWLKITDTTETFVSKVDNLTAY